MGIGTLPRSLLEPSFAGQLSRQLITKKKQWEVALSE
jgi:hypothetical protein